MGVNSRLPIMKVFLSTFLLLYTANAISFVNVVLEEWETWKMTHSKNYDSYLEEKFRLKIFMENKARVEKHNRLASMGKHSYELKMNHFGDLLNHEFRAIMNGYKMRSKNQTRPFQAATFIRNAHIEALPDNVDCSQDYGNQGCNGGLMDNAFQYIKENGGIDTERSYPYEGEDDVCRYDQKWKGAIDVGFVDVEMGNEIELKHAIASQGPCSIAIDASHLSFQFYSSGIYSEPQCDPGALDHGVLLVGYGVEEDGSKYWLIKNSWSEFWGDNGYMKIAREEDNMCGVATQASY